MLVFEIQVHCSNIHSYWIKNHYLVSLTNWLERYIRCNSVLVRLSDALQSSEMNLCWSISFITWTFPALLLRSFSAVPLSPGACQKHFTSLNTSLNQLTKLFSECPDLLAGWEERLLCVWQDILPVRWFNLFGNMRIGVFSPDSLQSEIGQGHWSFNM